ncbi:SCO family protein [Marinomonas agarivorans]|nr:SCO family protein [Marinomonas agarivorans]
MFIALLASLFLAGIATSVLLQPNSGGDKSSFGQSTLGGDFSLRSISGEVKLSDFSGKVVLLFFGYTNCPDICPITLANVSRAMKQIEPRKLPELQTLFISVDPKRDTLEHLDNYTKFFGENFIGLTGSKKEIDKVVRQYGAVYRIVELEDSAIEYSVDHSTRLYLIDRDGQIADYLYHNSTPEEIADKVNLLL